MGKHSKEKRNDKKGKINTLDELNNKSKKSRKSDNIDEIEYIPKKTLKSHNKKKKKKSILKKLILKFIAIVAITAFIIFFIWQLFECFKWQSIAKQMCTNTNSIVFDINGTTIASIGNERIHKNIENSSIPSNLKNAYVAIEDERYYKHNGVDLKRTGRSNFFLSNTLWERLFWWKYNYPAVSKKSYRK